MDTKSAAGKIVTIGRECGSGGRGLARKLADALGVPFYDKELIGLAAKETGLSEQFIQQAEERRTGSFLYNLYFDSRNLPVADQVFIAQSEVIRRVAGEGPCVIAGRCADYVLRERPDCLHVFIHAPLEQRIRRVREEYGVAGDPRAYVLKQDKARAAYYNHFTTGRWGDCRGYDLAVSSALGEDAVLRVLLELAGRGERP